jgi:predicted Zn-dependent peptidase
MIETTDWRIHQTDNNIPVVFKKRDDCYSVAIGLWLRTGSRYETRETNGISHLLEHLVFKGTATRSAKDLKEAIEGHGGSFNGFTSSEITCYYVKILAPYLDLSLDILADMVASAKLAPSDIENEKKVISEEIRMDLDNPARFVGDLLDRAMFGDHPLGWPVLGTEETIARMSGKDILHHREKHYHADSIVLSVCGNFEETELKELADKYFTGFPHRGDGKFIPFTETAGGPFVLSKMQETEQVHFCLGFYSYERDNEKKYALSVLNTILGGNMSSRLFDEVREKRALAYDIRSYAKAYYDTGSFVISAGTAPGKLRESIQVIRDEIFRIKDEPVSEEEIVRAKEYIISHILMGLEDNLEYMLWIGEQTCAKKHLYTLKEIEENIKKVTIEQVRKVAQEIFQKERLRCAVIGAENYETDLTSQLERI